jgi:hypothetical protein
MFHIFTEFFATCCTACFIYLLNSSRLAAQYRLLSPQISVYFIMLLLLEWFIKYPLKGCAGLNIQICSQKFKTIFIRIEKLNCVFNHVMCRIHISYFSLYNAELVDSKPDGPKHVGDVVPTAVYRVHTSTGKYVRNSARLHEKYLEN